MPGVECISSTTQVERRPLGEVGPGQPGERHLVVAVEVSVDQPEGRAIGHEHIRGPGGHAQLGAQPMDGDRPVAGQPAEQIELEHRGDQQIQRVHPRHGPGRAS